MKIKLPVITTIIIVAFFLLPKSTFASTLYLSPGGGAISIGGITSIQVRLSAGGDAVNGVSAFLSYPADKLDVAWVSPGSAFAIEAEKSYGGGSIKISRGNISGVTGDVNVATIGFRGKSTGSATVSFVGGSAAPRASDSSDSLNLGGSRGGVYNVAAGVPKPAAKASPSSSSGTQVTQLIISNVTVSAVSTNTATVSWQTNGKSDSFIEYGLEKDKYFLSTGSTQLATSHSLKLENALLGPGLKIHFRVKSKDSDNHEAMSEDQELQLTGYQVKIKVTDEAGNPLSGVEVWLYSDPVKAVTDTNGEAIFNNVSPGKHLAVVKAPDGDKSSEVLVAADTSGPAGSNYAVIKINKPVKQSPKIFPEKITLPQILALSAGIAVLLILIGTTMMLRRRKTRPPKPLDEVPGQPDIYNSS